MKKLLGYLKNKKILLCMGTLFLFLVAGFTWLYLKNDNQVDKKEDTKVNSTITSESIQKQVYNDLGLTFKELNKKYHGVKEANATGLDLETFSYKIIFNDVNYTYYFNYQLSDMAAGFDIKKDFVDSSTKAYKVEVLLRNFYGTNIDDETSLLKEGFKKQNDYSRFSYLKEIDKYKLGVYYPGEAESIYVYLKSLEPLIEPAFNYVSVDYPLQVIGVNYSKASKIMGKAIDFSEFCYSTFRTGYSYSWTGREEGDLCYGEGENGTFLTSPIYKDEATISQYNTNFKKWMNTNKEKITKSDLDNVFDNVVWDCKMDYDDYGDCGDDQKYKTCTISGTYKGFYFTTPTFGVDDLNTKEIDATTFLSVGKEQNKDNIHPPVLRC